MKDIKQLIHNVANSKIQSFVNKLQDQSNNQIDQLLDDNLSDNDKEIIFNQVKMIKKILMHQKIYASIDSIKIDNNLINYTITSPQSLKLYDNLDRIINYVKTFVNSNSKFKFENGKLFITTILNTNIDRTMPESFDNITLGINTLTNTPIKLDKLNSIIIAGQIQSGKTTLVNNIIKTLPDNSQLYLFVDRRDDYKNIQKDHEFIKFEQCYDKLKEIEIELNNRLDLNDEEIKNVKPIYIIIDDYTNAIGLDINIEKLVRSIANKGSIANIQIILVAKRPSADIVSPALKANISQRLSFKTTDSVNSSIVIDSTGAEKLNKNEFLFKQLDGRIIKGITYINTQNENL